MAKNEALCTQTLEQLAPQIKSGKLSPVALTQAYLERIEEMDPKVNCYITVTRNLAMEQAERAEQVLRAMTATLTPNAALGAGAPAAAPATAPGSNAGRGDIPCGCARRRT